MSQQSWKTDVLTQWQQIGLEGFCKELDISYEDVFLKPINNSTLVLNPFEGLDFKWWPHSQAPEGLVHLYPIVTPTSQVTWEEWFIKPDGLHHHVLRNYEHKEATDTWMGDDDDHPPQVCNIQWYYINDADLRPVVLR
jgi:hypothetical protein